MVAINLFLFQIERVSKNKAWLFRCLGLAMPVMVMRFLHGLFLGPIGRRL